MGTRADFYVGRGPEAEWLGSIAFDGYPDGPSPKQVRDAQTEDEYRTIVEDILRDDDRSTHPEQGWPWPWENSETTDYAYAFDEGKVWASGFGSPWWIATEKEPDPDEGDNIEGPRAIFPDMTEVQNVTFGRRSGLLILGGPRSE